MSDESLDSLPLKPLTDDTRSAFPAQPQLPEESVLEPPADGEGLALAPPEPSRPVVPPVQPTTTAASDAFRSAGGSPAMPSAQVEALNVAPLAAPRTAEPSAVTATAPTVTGDPGSARFEWLPVQKPALDQTLRNMRVWLPFLANPADRNLQARFGPDDYRVGLTWKIPIPPRCWHCGGAEQLSARNYHCSLRSFEYPVGVAISSLAAAFVSILIALFWVKPGLILFFFSLLIGAMVLFLKSWTEEIRLSFWICPEHAEPMKPPGMVIEDQHLHLFFANAEVARAAEEDILERRRTGAGRRALGATGPVRTPAPATYHETSPDRPLPATPRPTSPPPVDLPPIKLAGDDE